MDKLKPLTTSENVFLFAAALWHSFMCSRSSKLFLLFPSSCFTVRFWCSDDTTSCLYLHRSAKALSPPTDGAMSSIVVAVQRSSGEPWVPVLMWMFWRCESSQTPPQDQVPERVLECAGAIYGWFISGGVQDPGFPGRTSRCSEMINDIHFGRRWFSRCD